MQDGSLEDRLERLTIADGFVALASIYAGFVLPGGFDPVPNAVAGGGVALRTAMNASKGAILAERYAADPKVTALRGARYAFTHTGSIALAGYALGSGLRLLMH